MTTTTGGRSEDAEEACFAIGVFHTRERGVSPRLLRRRKAFSCFNNSLFFLSGQFKFGGEILHRFGIYAGMFTRMKARYDDAVAAFGNDRGRKALFAARVARERVEAHDGHAAHGIGDERALCICCMRDAFLFHRDLIMLFSEPLDDAFEVRAVCAACEAADAYLEADDEGAERGDDDNEQDDEYGQIQH